MAGLVHRPVRKARSVFARQTGNLKLAQMLTGHADIGTGHNVISTFEEFGDGTCEARLFYRWPDGSRRPPLPPDVELPIGAGEPSRSIAHRSSSEPRQPNWMLRERESWRLR